MPLHPADVDVAILAGGLGTRLRPVIADRPKPLAAVAGTPFLAYLLRWLEQNGFRRVVLCVGHGGTQVAGQFGMQYGSLTLSYAWEPELRGTGGALVNALPQITSPLLLALNGDSFCAADLPAFLAWHQQHTAATASLLLTCVDDTRRYGRVDVEIDAKMASGATGGAITGFHEKGEKTGPGAINAGVYLFARTLLTTLPADRPLSLEREVFPALIGHGLHGWHGGGRFIDIGTPESYATADAFFQTLFTSSSAP